MLDKLFYTAPSLAEELRPTLGITENVINNAIRSGHLRTTRPGGTGKRLITREDAIAWLDPETHAAKTAY